MSQCWISEGRLHVTRIQRTGRRGGLSVIKETKMARRKKNVTRKWPVDKLKPHPRQAPVFGDLASVEPGIGL